MKSSLKKSLARLLVVGLLVTTSSFNTLAVTLDTIVSNELQSSERRKALTTFASYQLFSEGNKFLMTGDEQKGENSEDSSTGTTMPVDISLDTENINDENNNLAPNPADTAFDNKENEAEAEEDEDNTNTKNNSNENTANENDNNNDNENYNNKENKTTTDNTNSLDTTNNKSNTENNTNTVNANNNTENKNNVDNSGNTENKNNTENTDNNSNENKSNNNTENATTNSEDIDINIDTGDMEIIKSDLTLTNQDKNNTKNTEANENADVATDSDIDSINQKTVVFGAGIPQYVWFGTYPQNDTTGVQLEPIKWRVLSQNGEEALLISDRILDEHAYHAEQKLVNITWEHSQLRAWLNSSSGFLGKAFNNSEQNAIKQKKISNPNNPYSPYVTSKGNSGGNDTNDKIFALTIQEALNLFYCGEGSLEDKVYFESDDRIATCTPYALRNCTIYPEAHNTYWLRTPGYDQQNFTNVDYKGRASLIGSLEDEQKGVRPALYVDLTANNFKFQNNTVTWDKSLGWSFNSASILWDSYDTYIGGQQLPTNDNIVERAQYGKLLGWRINKSETIYTEIPANQTGPIILAPVFERGAIEYNINWNLGDGKFKDEYKADFENAKHNDIEDYILPTQDKIDLPYNQVLKNWTIDGVATTSISKDIHKEVTVTANYTRLVKNFESYSIGKYKLTADATDTQNLEWIVLDKKDGKLLLTTKNIIDVKSYDTEGHSKFDDANLSTWLNGDFYNQVFDDTQKENVLNIEGNHKVFLLTKERATEYFANDVLRVARASDYAKAIDNDGTKLNVKNSVAPYWLMTDVESKREANPNTYIVVGGLQYPDTGENGKAPYVDIDGTIKEGKDSTSKDIGIRPCIWVMENKISDIKMKPLAKILNAINKQLTNFFSFMNKFFGKE